MNDSGAAIVAPKRLHPIVFILIYSAPILFVWLLLRKGYSSSLRVAGFTFALFLGFIPFALTILNPSLLLR
ncbi:MAG: hypothetical protein V4530_09635 [Pseudomonadota bacterium]